MHLSVILVSMILCGAADGYGRHIQGGAPGTHRWEAMVLYGFSCLPALGVYGYQTWATSSWEPAVVGVLIVALLYADMTWKQDFGSLILGGLRYCLPVAVLSALTGCWVVLIFMLPIFLALKWAKSADDTKIDPHVWFEIILGSASGAAWGVAPLVRGW